MPNLIHNLPFPDYLALDAYSSSQLKLVLDCPARLAYAKANPEDPKKTYFVEGRGLHGLALENRQTYVIHPEKMPDSKGELKDWSLRLNSAKQWVGDQGGADVVSPDKHLEILAWADAIKNNPRSRNYIQVDGRSEVTGVATDPETGLQLRIRIDWLPAEGSSLFDIKTAACVSLDAVQKAMDKLNYCVQAYHYLHVYNLIAEEFKLPRKELFTFIFVEKTPPYMVEVYTLDYTWMAIGRKRHARALQLILDSTKSGEWGGYGTGDTTLLQAPEWVLRKEGLV
jgi:hypothetical protein